MQGKKILIFDDDQDLISIFTFVFENLDWQVYAYQNCDQVVELAEKINPQLILMDNWIPNIGGIAATKLLKANKNLQKIPVIFVSANNDIKSLHEQAGADAFIAKPFNFSQLEDLVENLQNKSN